MASKKTVAGTAADPTIRYAKLKIEGETYSLAFDFNALATAESMTGLNLMQALRSLDDLSVSQLRALLYAALLKAQRITVQEAGEILNLRNIPAVTRAIGEALKNSLPEESENPQEPELVPADN